MPNNKSTENDSQAVLAYRVGQLEKATTEGIKALNDKLDNLTHNFATTADIVSLEQHGTSEHQRIEARIDETNKDVKEIQDWMTWATRIIVGAVILGILTVIGVSAN